MLRRAYRVQNYMLLMASMVFYGCWDVRFLYLFILTTAVDFYCALMINEGRVSLRQRIIESTVLVGSAFFCVTVQWPAVHVERNALRLTAWVDWSGLLPGHLSGWAVLLVTLAVVGMVNLCNPLLIRVPEDRRRKVFLIASIMSNLGVLGFFKYYNFFATSFVQLVHTLVGVTPSTWTLSIILPVGISFYTFQSMAYTIDVYRKKVPAVGSYLDLATCLSFFPLLVAGPIERPHHFFPQFFRHRLVSRDMFRDGIWLIVWGLFKKMVVADNMAVIVTSVFGPYDGASPSAVVPHDGLRLAIGVYAFAFQIYGDFSGYTDIARGTAKLLGFDIMLNFNLPYFAVSPSDFWQRWHISLSSWLRDYLYIPLGGNRGGQAQTCRNLLLTMLLGGLWHGANWTFVLWGAFHGLLLVGYRLLMPDLAHTPGVAPTLAATMAPAPSVARIMAYSSLLPLPTWAQLAPRLRSAFRHGLCVLLMFQLTCVGWLLFRAQSLAAVGVFVQGILLNPHWSPEATAFLKSIAYYGWFLTLFQVLQWRAGTLDIMGSLPWFVRLNIWVFVIMSLLTVSARTEQAFIYFAF